MSVKRAYRFAAVPEWVLFHPELEAIDVRVFGVLDRYAHGGNGVAWPGLKRIAQLAGAKSEDTARRAIRRLERVGAVVVEPDRDDSGRQRSNRYALAGDAPVHNRGSTAATPEDGTDARGEGGTAATQKREVKNERSRNERTPSPPRTGASLVALAAPTSDVAIRERIPQVLNAASALSKEAGRPLLPSERAGLALWVNESLHAGYDADELSASIASAAFRTPKGVSGELGKRRQEPTSVGNRGFTSGAVNRFMNGDTA